MTSLDAALQQFDATEANLTKLEKLWKRINALLPTGPAFGGPPELQELCLAFRRILPALPTIDGYGLADCLPDYDEVGQMHLDALELGEIAAQVAVDRFLEEQGNHLREYRFRFQAKRRELVRDRLVALITLITQLLDALGPSSKGQQVNSRVMDQSWDRLKEAVNEVDLLLGSTPRPSRWRGSEATPPLRHGWRPGRHCAERLAGHQRVASYSVVRRTRPASCRRARSIWPRQSRSTLWVPRRQNWTGQLCARKILNA